MTSIEIILCHDIIKLDLIIEGIVIRMEENNLTEEQKKNIEINKKILKGCGKGCSIGCGVLILLCILLLIIISFLPEPSKETTPDTGKVKKIETQVTVDKAEYDKKAKSIESDLNKIFVRLNVSQNAYIYYIDVFEWHTLKYEQKEDLIKICANYGKFKTYNPSTELSELLAKTVIKSVNDRKTLGEFTPFGGYKFK